MRTTSTSVSNTTDLTQIKAFLNSVETNSWLKVGTMKVYVRKGFHNVAGETLDTFDLASFEQVEKQRGKGKFWQFILDLRNLLNENTVLRGPIKGIYIECVLNDRLLASLPPMGFLLVSTSVPESFYMEL